MPKRRERTPLKLIAEAIELADLRLRLADDLGHQQRRAAAIELIEAKYALEHEIGRITRDITLYEKANKRRFSKRKKQQEKTNANA